MHDTLNIRYAPLAVELLGSTTAVFKPRPMTPFSKQIDAAGEVGTR